MKKRLLSLFVVFALVVSSFCGIVAFADSNSEISGEQSAKIRIAANAYFAENKNGSTSAGLEAAVKETYSDAKVESFFIYKAADGVYDEDETYPLSIPGHDGYVSAVLSLDGAKTGVLYTIPHSEENLGKLTVDVYSESNTNFTTDSGNITDYTGTAEKIVIPSTFSGTVKKLQNATGKANVKVLYIGGGDSEMTISFNNAAFRDWQSLRAIEFPNKINGRLVQFSFMENKNLKYVKLPHSVKYATAGSAGIGQKAFADCPLLETAYCPCCFKMPEAVYAADVFSNTKISTYYLPKNIDFVSGAEAKTVFGTNPPQGFTPIVMTDEELSTADFTRAAVLAQSAADDIDVVASDTDATVLNKIISAYTDLDGTQGITAEWESFSHNDDIANGVLNLSFDGAVIPVKLQSDKSVSVSGIEVKDYQLTPAFDPYRYDYDVTVPYTATSLDISPIPAKGAKILSIIGNESLSLNAENKVVISAVSRNGTVSTYVVTVERLPEKTELNNAVKAAAEKYIAEVGNGCTEDGLLAAVNKAISPAVAERAMTDGYFVYHSVNGVYDQDPDESTRLSIPGHDGYMATALKLYENGSVVSVLGLNITIPHIEENLGVLTKSKASDFEVDANGDLINYKGNAKKVIIPSTVRNIKSTGASTNKGLQKAVVLITKNSGKIIDKSAFRSATNGSYGWVNLKAADLSNISMFGERAFSGLKNLKYVKFISAFGASDYFEYAAFADNYLLENINLPSGARFRGSVFSNTSIRDFYENNGVFHNYDSKNEYYDYVKPKFSDGTRVILTEEDYKKVTLARAAVLAQAKADSMSVIAGDTENTCLDTITSAYSKLDGATNITASWKDFTHNGETAKGTLILSVGSISIPVYLRVNPDAGLINLEINGQTLNPSFSPEVTEYELVYPVSSAIKKLTVNTCPANGAVVDSITGSENLSYGDSNLIKIETTSKSGAKVTYSVKVVRLSADEALFEKARIAFENYINEVGNGCTEADALKAVNNAISPVTANVSEDGFFIYHSVDGVYDEDTDESTRISIPGHNGYVAAVLNFSEGGKDKGSYGVSAVIPHKEENLGVLTKSKPEDFVINASGNLTAYTGNAQKVIIPDTVNNISSLNVKANSGTKKAIALITKNTGVTVSARAFQSATDGSYGFTNLKAADLSNNVIFGERAFSGLKELKYLKLATDNVYLKTRADGSKYNERGYFDYAAFATNAKLENVTLPGMLTMKGNVFSGTAVRDFYEGSATVHTNTSEYPDYGKPAFTSGTRVVLTQDDQKKFPMSRVMTLILDSMNTAEIDSDDDSESILEKCLNKCKTMGAEYVADWNDFSFNGDIVKGTISVGVGDERVTIPFYRDRSIAVENLILPDDYAFNKPFESGVYDYDLTVYNTAESLYTGIMLTPGSELVSVTGNTDLSTQKTNIVEITVKAPNGETKNYTLNVTREKAKSFDEAVETVKQKVALTEFTNNSGLGELGSVIENAIKGQPFETEVADFYIYKAINGATENGTTILVDGHKGYITADVIISNTERSEHVPLKVTVKPVMEDYTFKSVSSINDFVISDDGKTLLTYDGDAEKVVFPEGIEFIDDLYLYSDTSGIKCVILPESLRKLPTSLCYNMNDLEVAYIGNNVVEAGAGVFMNCASLKYVHLSENLAYLPSTMFSHTLSLAQVYIPQNVTEIRSNTFYRSLVRDVTLSNSISLISDNAFSWCINNATYFSSGSLGAIVTKEQGQRIQNDIVSKVAYNNGVNVPRTITVLNPNVEVSAGAFAGDSTGAWGINAIRAPENSTFNDYFAEVSSSSTSYVAKQNLTALDMSLTEAAARAQIVADGLELTADATASSAKAIIDMSYLGQQVAGTKWIEDFKISDNRITGKLEISNAEGLTFEVVIDTPVFVKAEPITESEEDDNSDEYEIDVNTDELINEPEYIRYRGTHEEERMKTVRKKIRVKMKRTAGNDDFVIPVWVWIAGGAVVLAAGTFVVILIVKKRKKRT